MTAGRRIPCTSKTCRSRRQPKPRSPTYPDRENCPRKRVHFCLEGSLRLGDDLLLRAGVNNLFDKDPPYYTDPIDQNTDPFTYDLLGRRYFLKATYTF